MKEFDVVKKNYTRGLWTDKMLDKLVEKNVIPKAHADGLKADKAKEKAGQTNGDNLQ